MSIQFKQLLIGTSIAVSILAFGGPVSADVVTRTRADMLNQAGRGNVSADDGITTGVRALQLNAADVGRGFHGPLPQSPGTLIGTAKSPAMSVKGGAAGLDDKFGRR